MGSKDKNKINMWAKKWCQKYTSIDCKKVSELVFGIKVGGIACIGNGVHTKKK